MKGVGNGDYRWIVPVWDSGNPDQRGDVMADRETEEVTGRTEQAMERRIIRLSDGAHWPPALLSPDRPRQHPPLAGPSCQSIML